MTDALYDIPALRTIEARAHDADGTSLMERAGQAAWRALLDAWPQAQRIAVVCGPGNNGGDGLVLARHAHEAGRHVRVIRHAAHASRTETARAVLARYVDAGGTIDVFDGAIDACDVVVDALLGIGLSRAPDGDAASVIDAINAAGVPVFALDVPSGVDAATGHAFASAVRATRTIEFIACKAGLRTGAARGLVGALSLAGLDLDAAVFDDVVPVARRLDASHLHRWLHPRALDSHKGTHGRVLCVGGDIGHGGAILLAAEAALRSGAGLVDIETRGRHVGAALARMPEAMAQATHDTHALRVRVEQASACVLGPGLGQDTWGRERFDTCIDAARALVLDADALNLLAQTPRPLPPHTILTPHPGEAARLLDCSTQDIQRDRIAAARALCDRHDAVVVLKGAGTLVAAPGQVMHVIDAGNPGMAVGGMGDVLVGVIGSLRAQGLDAFDAACAGALLHAVAGDVAARDGGERGLLPTDLMHALRVHANPVWR